MSMHIKEIGRELCQSFVNKPLN